MKNQQNLDALQAANKELNTYKLDKKNRASELLLANIELNIQNEEKEKQAAELLIANKELEFQNEEKEKRAEELLIANRELAFQNEEKEKRAAELVLANQQLVFQNREKEKRADELVIANKELEFQNEEKEKRAAELILANQELLFQNKEKAKKAAELLVAQEEHEFEIAQRVEAEDRVLKMNEELENKISERTADLQKALKEVLDYKTALDESAIVVITDQNGIIKHANQNFAAVSKYSVSELIGKDHFLVNSGFHSKEFMGDLWATIKNGKIWKGEIKNRAKDDSIYWVDTTIVPFLNLDNVPYQYLAIRSDITERKNAEEQLLLLHKNLDNLVLARTKELLDTKEKLTESLERVTYLATIANNILDPIITTDNNFKITRWNLAAEMLFGWKSEDVIGKNPDQILNIEYPYDTLNDVKKKFSSSGIWNGEVIYHTKANAEVYVLLTVSELLNSVGETMGTVCLVRNITSRKKAEEKLRVLNTELEQKVEERTNDIFKSEKRFKAIIENGADSVLILSADLKPTYASPSIQKIIGYSESEALELDLLELIHPDDVAGVAEKVKSCFENPGIPVPGYTSRIRHKNGSWRWLEATITNLLNDPAVHGIVDNFRDITERKELEERLKRANILARIGGWEIDLVTETVYWTDITREIHETAPDYMPDLASGLNFYKEGKDKDLISQKVKEAIGLGTSWDLELQITTAKNNELWIRSIGETEFMDGKCVRIYGSFQDIDKRKKAEEEIHILNENLELRVKERTEELESFSYSVSHDLRAPLRAVNGYARILEEDYNTVLDTEGLRLLAEVQNNARRMGFLIDDLLAFSRLGRKDVVLSLVDMDRLTANALLEVQSQTPSRVKVKFKNLIPIEADPHLIEQVMVNLLSNALKYSSKTDHPKVSVESKRENGRVVYSVKDNGAGFDMKYAHKLFGVFQRLHSNEEFTGTGVGLAIVQRIIQKHKGKIWAEGGVGEGATFFFSIPDSI